MEELAVAGLEESDAKGIPDAHDPKLGHLGGKRSNGIPDLNRDPVEMKQNEAGKCEGETTDTNGW